MPLDGISAKCLALELNTRLKDARVDKIYQPDRHDILMVLRTQQENLRLILSANPSAPRIHLTTETRENPNEPPMFCMLLRKHLLGARIIQVETPGYERIVILTFQTTNELGDTLYKKLIIEAMGRHSNIIFTNQDDRIHDAIFHVDDAISRLREIMPARTYILPANQAKPGPAEVLAKLEQNQSPLLPEVQERPLEKALLESIQGFSPQLCRDICEAAGLDSRSRFSQLSPTEQQSFQSTLHNRLQQIVAGDFAPTTYYLQSEDKIPVDFHALRLNSLANPRPEASLSAAMDRFYLERNRQNKLVQQKQALLKRLENEIENTSRRLVLHEQELAEGEKREQYREYGELLVAQQFRISEGTEAVEVDNYFDPDLKPIQIPLQPQLNPAQNVQRYFKLYQKARGKYEMNSKLVITDRQDLDWLQSLLSATQSCVDDQDVRAIREELAVTGLSNAERRMKAQAQSQNGQELSAASSNSNARDLLPGKPGARSKRQAKYNQQTKGKASQDKAKAKAAAKNPPPLPPRQFLSSDGLLIQAGRNNLQNDRLTLRTAQKDDLWFHAQKIPGTHVIIRCGKQTVPAKTIEEAAQIAAWFSQGQTGSKVAVDYCPVSHVKKIAGGKPGLVQYDQYQTVLVEPKDPEKSLQHPAEKQFESEDER